MTGTTVRVVHIGSAHGLHARPAKMFVEAAKAAGFPIEVSNGATTVNAASILGVLSLGANQGDEITISTTGEGAAVDEVLDRLESVLRTDHDSD
ncbi:MAG: HPr family phosphocarrier protein [Microbacterium sp.]